MGLTDENRKDIVTYRIERAFAALEQAKLTANHWILNYCCPLKFKIEGNTCPRCTKIGDMCFFSEE